MATIGRGSRRAFKLALLQLRVGADKADNVARALAGVRAAAAAGAEVVCLPEVFNSPYGNQHFPRYAEPVPGGPTCASLAGVAMETGVHLIGGSLPEVDPASGRLYNTCVCYGPGDTADRPALIYRKCHLFDIDVPGGIKFKESDTLSPGDRLQSWQTPFLNIGLGICYDIRFPRMAERLAVGLGCDLLVYPGAFNTTTGPAHWELLARAQSVQNQVFTAVCSPAASDPEAGGYAAHGHSMVVDPWGRVLADCGPGEGQIIVEVDPARCDQIRGQIPLRCQQRTELY